MKPVPFTGCNIVFGEGQKEYAPLPARWEPSGLVTACWKLSLWDRLRLLITGRLWVTTLTFLNPMQPQSFSTRKPEELP